MVRKFFQPTNPTSRKNIPPKAFKALISKRCKKILYTRIHHYVSFERGCVTTIKGPGIFRSNDQREMDLYSAVAARFFFFLFLRLSLPLHSLCSLFSFCVFQLFGFYAPLSVFFPFTLFSHLFLALSRKSFFFS